MVLSEETKQKVMEKWEKAFETTQALTSPQAILPENNQMKYHHTKQHVDIYDMKSHPTTIVRGDVIVEGLKDANELMERFANVKYVSEEKDEMFKRVELLEEWTDNNDGSVWKIQYYCLDFLGI